MAVFNGGDAIKEFLAECDSWLSESVEMYLLGGSAMTARGLKDQTEDIDLGLAVTTEFEHVYGVIRDHGFEATNEPTAAFEDVGKTVELHHPDRGTQIDLFERQVVGKVWITERMHDRATEFWAGERATAYVLSDEDMFLLKAVSGGDVGAGRHRDIEDMRTYAQRGLTFDVILKEIEKQRPFNTGSTEARHIRARSHPLFAIEMALQSLSGFPDSFMDRVSELATEFETEYIVLRGIEDGLQSPDVIEEHVLSNVRALSIDDDDAVSAALDRLVEKGILEQDGEEVRLQV
ncbi:hypothetical protein C475_18998 [Halosimplex carlsbadense 2-9-1]|uniref:DUF2204 family protein n=1 Tax=Halosimplex carlsbadense 2-9-1 TaxID=797114 RepID=M0CCT0_9EURY|nr:hypothetical protein [Halosimplex carlsbadense]ELZ21076.1 hypothetical protein C475_18998 [Halosimplex carlsbadense 2-9-1]